MSQNSVIPDFPDAHALQDSWERLQAALLDSAGPGFWVTGHLSSSALSTAVAICALRQFPDNDHWTLIDRALQWLVEHQNEDGGWGDTPDSPSNPSTTLLVWCALHEQKGTAAQAAEAAAEEYLGQWLGSSVKGPQLARAVLRAYGRDRTFSVPILSCCAIMGRLGSDSPWKQVPQLPFELAALPHRFYRWARLPVVSYALPALIAIGLVRHRACPSRNPALRTLRNRLTPRLLDLLESIQPENGGFLEAAPLTAFVTMSLASAGLFRHLVARKGRQFLLANVRSDGSWPIDTNLATWLTTLSIQALNTHPDSSPLTAERAGQVRNSLLRCQFQSVHPFTQAEPGGWAWTDLPGGVPDADDTSGALLALAALDQEYEPEVLNAARMGIKWLIALQNRDGGIPTFCKGWGRLPFDRSCPDITAHALRAWNQWLPHQPPEYATSMLQAIDDAIEFLLRSQDPSGSWVPLWFGCQHSEDQTNPTYGTSRVLFALETINQDSPAMQEAIAKARKWLQNAQLPDGSWGGGPGAPGTVEETGLAVTALAAGEPCPALGKGLAWLVQNLDRAIHPQPAPIGLYFAKLWYSEQAYPLIFATEAVGNALQMANAIEG